MAEEDESRVMITVLGVAVSWIVCNAVVYTEVESTAEEFTATIMMTLVTKKGDTACLDSVGWFLSESDVLTKVATTGWDAESKVATVVTTAD